MILRVLEQEFGFDTGKRVDVCLGHSLGEFAALVSSRHLQYEDALRSTYFSELVLPLMDHILILETCFGGSLCSKHVPRLDITFQY